MSVIVSNHKPYPPGASHLRRLERRILPHDPFSKVAQETGRFFRNVAYAVFPSAVPAWTRLNNHAACLVIHDVILHATSHCNVCSGQQIKAQSASHTFNGLYCSLGCSFLSICCSDVRFVFSKGTAIQGQCNVQGREESRGTCHSDITQTKKKRNCNERRSLNGRLKRHWMQRLKTNLAGHMINNRIQEGVLCS